MANRTPVVFFGHGSPMTTLTKNKYTTGWAKIGQAVPRPREILCISAHWYVRGPAVISSIAPPTIHDFGGFPQALFDIEYPAHGSPTLARQVQKLLAPIPVELSEKWGYDHGTWSVLRHMYPHADVPVVQLSIDGTRPPEYHYEVGKRLATLRDQGVMIVGSGNLVHNLGLYQRNDPALPPFEWALKFDTRARELMLAKDYEQLTRYEKLGREAALSIPTPDHYLPLLYVLGAADKKEAIHFPIEGFDGGSMSMLTVQVG
ncbi:MAG: 4,5-DOPA dioxygenase extradiol [Acidobacteriota bacterium]